MSNTDLHIAAIQAKLTWHQPEENFKHINELVSDIKNADLIVLPEMWSSGFTMNAEKYHLYSSEAVDLMKRWSHESGAALVGSLIVKEEDSYFNRLYYINNGVIENYYDKRHLFAYAGEDRHFKKGHKRVIIDLKGWKLLLNICYDLRFPVWCRNTDDYDVLIFVANWPNPRIEAWNTLLKARAIENQAFVVGVNCVGTDAWKNEYSGYSSIISYDGSMLQSFKDQPTVLRQALNKSDLKSFRNKLPFLKDKDSFEINLKET